MAGGRGLAGEGWSVSPEIWYRSAVSLLVGDYNLISSNGGGGYDQRAFIDQIVCGDCKLSRGGVRV